VRTRHDTLRDVPRTLAAVPATDPSTAASAGTACGIGFEIPRGVAAAFAWASAPGILPYGIVAVCYSEIGADTLYDTDAAAASGIAAGAAFGTAAGPPSGTAASARKGTLSYPPPSGIGLSASALGSALPNDGSNACGAHAGATDNFTARTGFTARTNGRR